MVLRPQLLKLLKSTYVMPSFTLNQMSRKDTKFSLRYLYIRTTKVKLNKVYFKNIKVGEAIRCT